MGPTKAAPLIRSIELLESHFERGAGVLNAVQARLSRRQLPRITADGLVEYSLQIPRSAMRYTSSGRGRGSGSPIRGGHKKYGADIEWILAGRLFLNSDTNRYIYLKGFVSAIAKQTTWAPMEKVFAQFSGWFLVPIAGKFDTRAFLVDLDQGSYGTLDLSYIAIILYDIMCVMQNLHSLFRNQIKLDCEIFSQPPKNNLDFFRGLLEKDYRIY